MEFEPTGEARAPKYATPALETGMPSHTRIDWEYFALTRTLSAESGGELAVELVALFVHDAPEAAQGIRLALRALRAPDVARQAHRLKGMALALGATSVAEASGDIEQLALAGTLTTIGRMLDALDRDIVESIRRCEHALQLPPDDQRNAAASAIATEIETAPRARRRGELHGLTVLLADDDAVNRLVAREMLVAAGARVGEAVDGADAVERLQAAHYDIVLMDVQMPTLDGIGAVRQIRALANERHRRVPVIALTASVSSDDAALALQGGCQAVLRKPLTPDALLGAIGAVLG